MNLMCLDEGLEEVDRAIQAVQNLHLKEESCMRYLIYNIITVARKIRTITIFRWHLA